MPLPQGIRPTLLHKAGRGGAAFGSHQRIVVPRLRWVKVEFGRCDVELPGEGDGDLFLQQLPRMCAEPLEPVEFVLKLRTGLRIAVG